MAGSSSEKSDSKKGKEASIKNTHLEASKKNEGEDSIEGSVVETSEMSEKQPKVTALTAKQTTKYNMPAEMPVKTSDPAEPVEASLSKSYYSQSSRSSSLNDEEHVSLPSSEESESSKYYAHELNDSEPKVKSGNKPKVKPTKPGKPVAKVIRKPPMAITSNAKSASAQFTNSPKATTASAHISKQPERKSKRKTTVPVAKTERGLFASGPLQSSGKPVAFSKQAKTKPAVKQLSPIARQVRTSNVKHISTVECLQEPIANANGQIFTNNRPVFLADGGASTGSSTIGSPVISPIIRVSRFSRLYRRRPNLFSQPMLLYWDPTKQGTISPDSQKHLNALLLCRVADCTEHASILTVNLQSHSLYIFVDHSA